MKQLTNEAFSPEESKKIYDNFLSIVGTRRDKLVKRYGSEAEKVAYAKAVKQVKKQAEEKPMEKEIEEGTCGYGVDGEIGDTPAGPMLIRLKEMVKDALKNPKKADLNKDGKLSDYEKKRGAAIEKAMQKEDISESSDMWNKMSDDEKEDALLSAVKDPDEALKYLDFAYNDLPSEVTQNMRFLQKEFETDEELISDEPISEEDKMSDEEKQLMKDLGDSFRQNRRALEKRRKEEDAKRQADYERFKKAKGIEEDIDVGHTDDEPGMLKADLYRIGKYAMELYKMVDKFDEMDSEVDFPHWWQSKITKSKGMLVSAKHYLDFEMKEPQIDAMVDVASEEGVIDEKLKPSMGAGAYVDDFKDSKAPQFKGKSKKKKQEMAVAAYLSAKDKKKVAEAVVKKLSENPATVKAVEKLQPILFDILKATEKVDKSQDDTEADVEELDKSIDYLSAALTGDSAIKVATDQSAYGRLASPKKKVAEAIFNKLRS